jgi:hypothetical protein
LSTQWQLFLAGSEYGYDIARSAVEFQPGRPLAAGGASVEIASDRGWQSSGLRLEEGVTYQLRASGRYQVADQPRIWWCEPGGVTIRYYQGRPLGMLLGAIQGDLPEPQERKANMWQEITPLAKPFPIGLSHTITAKYSGTLYLRINDSAAELADNAGTLSVQITAK